MNQPTPNPSQEGTKWIAIFPGEDKMDCNIPRRGQKWIVILFKVVTIF